MLLGAGAELATFGGMLFNVYRIGAPIGDVAGVYVACRENPNALSWYPRPGSRWIPLYVGETGSFRSRIGERLRAHEGVWRARAEGATHFAVTVVEDEDTRRRIELNLRHALNPPCNWEGNALAGLNFNAPESTAFNALADMGSDARRDTVFNALAAFGNLTAPRPW